MLQDARIDQLIMDFARLDPTAEGVLSTREFCAALAKHGVDAARADALARKFRGGKGGGFGGASSSDLPASMLDVDYVAFLAHMEEAAQSQNSSAASSAATSRSPSAAFVSSPTQQEYFAGSPALQPGAPRSFGSRINSNNAGMMGGFSAVGSRQQKPSSSFVDRALSNASRALLSHHQQQQLPPSLSQAPAPPATTAMRPLHFDAYASSKPQTQQHPQSQFGSFQQLIDDVATTAVYAQQPTPVSPTPHKQRASLHDMSVALSPLTPGSKSFMAQYQQQQQRSSAPSSPVPKTGALTPEQEDRRVSGSDNENNGGSTAVLPQPSSVPSSSSSSTAVVSLPFIFSRVDRDGDGLVSVDDLLRCTTPPCFGRLELEVLVEATLLLASADAHTAVRQPAAPALFDAQSARLNLEQFCLLFSRMKPAAIARLRSPATWDGTAATATTTNATQKRQTAAAEAEAAAALQHEQQQQQSRLDIQRQARWNQKISVAPRQQQHHHHASPPPPSASPAALGNPSPRHQTPPRPTTRRSSSSAERQREQQSRAAVAARQQQQQQQQQQPVPAFMRQTTSSALRTGWLSADIEAVRRSVSTDSAASAASSSAASAAKSKSGSRSPSATQQQHNGIAFGAKITLRDAPPHVQQLQQQPRKQQQQEQPHVVKRVPVPAAPVQHQPVAAAAAAAAAFPVQLAALYRGKASHIMSMCQIVDRHSSGLVPAQRLVEILHTIHGDGSAADEDIAAAVALAVKPGGKAASNKAPMVDFAHFVRLLVAAAPAASSSSSSSSPSPRRVVASRQTSESAAVAAVAASVSPDSQNGGVSPSSQSRSPRAQPQQHQDDARTPPHSSSTSASRHAADAAAAASAADASETLRQMLRTELDRVTRGNPQRFIDCLLAASKGSKEHRTRNHWMVRCAELHEALAALYGQSLTAALSPSRAAASASAAANSNVYSNPPDWVVTRTKKIAQTPFHQAAPFNSLSCSPKAKSCRKRASEWLLANPAVKADEWCDAAFLLETLYLE